MKQNDILNWIADTNYSLMLQMDSYYFEFIALIIFIGCIISMSPLISKAEDTFIQAVCIRIRKLIIISFFIALFLPAFTLYIYDASQAGKNLESHNKFYFWLFNLFKHKWPLPLIAFCSGLAIRFIFMRYIMTFFSAIKRKLRFEQATDKPSDIRDEIKTYKTKDFLPSKHYKKNFRFIGLDVKNEPYYVSESTYRETHHQIIGPTRYGKGVLIGVLIDQAIRSGDQAFYIDPKKDPFVPAIMFQAARDMGKPFYYVALNDDSPGQWHPFSGGSLRDITARAMQAFELQLTGDAGTDFYKVKEMEHLTSALKESKTINGIKTYIQDFKTECQKLSASLNQWSEVDALNPKSGKGFSIEKALMQGAIVYVQGSLTDSIVKAATKAFITEVISESMRLKNDRTYHTSLYIDEIKFLISKEITDALATAAGFNVNISLAYQSLGDTLSPDDRTLDGKGLTQSININCQLKTIYGGFDPETAKWTSESSGSINKTVTQIEKTEIKDAGAELWDDSRSITNKEEYLIPENVFYTLPKRVCIQYQPATLAKICHTSFIPVSTQTNQDLTSFLNSINDDKEKKISSNKKTNQPRPKGKADEKSNNNNIKIKTDISDPSKNFHNPTNKKQVKPPSQNVITAPSKYKEKIETSDFVHHDNELNNDNSSDKSLSTKKHNTRPTKKNKIKDKENNDSEIIRIASSPSDDDENALLSMDTLSED